jgi:NDP-sugar pyrophosphorylase family protein
MDCVIVAGGRPAADDPLYPYSQGQPKALLEVAGRPLLDYILQALLQARSVERIVVAGLPARLARDHGVAGPESRVEFVDDQGGMIANALAGLALHRQRRPQTRHVLFTSADIPAATGPMIDQVLERCRPFAAAAYYFMVDRTVMEEFYPGSSRTYTRLRDKEVAGADLVIADARIADNRQLFEDIAAGRKRPWKMARIAGLTTILALLARRLTLESIQRRATRVLGEPVSVSLLEYPELAMDVDKPEQLRLLRDLLE